MARFAETDQAASLLQQILALSPSAGSAAAADWRAAESGEAAMPPAPWASPDLPATAQPRLAASETMVRELVATRAGYVQLTLHVSASESERLDWETVGQFFRRAVRPLSSADQSAV
ncbi:MAG: hypothetical protein CFK52_04095 [Chloracidobacterium sp. CP2_5A]|nr:MAG: hypothetical protein CFK52_04095 [Chloracidobacterium sp. CP2_5A]